MTTGTLIYGDENVDPSHSRLPRFTVLGELSASVPPPPNGCPCNYIVLCKSLSRHGDRLACEGATRVQYEDGTKAIL